MSNRVHCAVVTFNRKELLLECLEALARQTADIERVTVVDNASTDGTAEHLVASGIAQRLPVDYLRVERNGGGAEGFHYGVRAALASEPDWIWLMDDDCEPEPAALAELLRSAQASDPSTAVVAPLTTMPGGEVLPLNRGWLRRRWFLTPLVGLSPADWQGPPREVDHVSLVGPLVRATVAERTDPPRRDLFIWWDDLEWVSRLRRMGRVWLVPASRIVHHDPQPMPATDLRSRWREFRTPPSFDQTWKRTYGLRNLIFCGRREGYLTAARAAALASVTAARIVLFERQRARTLRLTGAYAIDGWRGRFRNVAPGDWPALARHPHPDRFIAERALAYDRDVAGAPRPVAELGRARNTTPESSGR
jgi:rhamnopyranosyl-N-acetylglucosaminyl-diphospho-decaprenol beta-1,3/1,4-galactofuranosyltransferase